MIRGVITSEHQRTAMTLPEANNPTYIFLDDTAGSLLEDTHASVY